jgi:hypothetical protein
MRVIAVLLSGFLASAFGAGQAPPARQARAVYLLPMANGLDQYLANHITSAGVFHVVTDPKKAEVVLTDRLGGAFESQMAELYPEPAPPKPAEKNAAEKEESEDAAVSLHAPPAPGAQSPSFGRGKGNVFLVDPHARAVLWSTYEKPRSSRSEDMDSAAGRIVSRFKHDAEKASGQTK